MNQQAISRRTFLKGAALSSAGLAVAACVPVAPTGSSTQSDAAGEEAVSLRLMSNSGIEAIAVYEDLLATDFRSQHENIDVTVEPTPDGWQEKLVAQMAAGAAVDLFEAWGNIFYNWTSRDLVLDLQPFVDAEMTDEEIADFVEFQWEGLEINGVRAGMPRYINLMTMTINVDLFEQYGVELPPEDGEWTWEEYQVMAQQLTDAARSAGEENQWGTYMRPWSWDRFWFWVDMFGGQVVNEKYGTECLLGTPEAQEALQWQYDMYWTWNCSARRDQIEGMWFADALTANMIGMAEESTYPVRIDRLVDGAFRWEMRHLPKGPTGERTVLGTTDAWAAWSGTEHPQACWEVLRYMSDGDFQLRGIVDASGQIPVRKSLMGDFITSARELRPNLENVRIETIAEIFEWGYASDAFWFKDQNGAAELIRPALEAIYESGSATPDIFVELAPQVTEAQQAA